ncbi:hypothetical protein TNIN_120081 [Trichonephila inaurata madagascariensis]|uniref:Uncharacterized protein n=1 Tax=Trichonephila inaurata madagascariensis TaxID=2747483 RepID=A0A8X7C8G9_9ARAC|nr:hypothetical protein TNIN_120081 [Trichonephila inaurata madagascariensis]
MLDSETRATHIGVCPGKNGTSPGTWAKCDIFYASKGKSHVMDSSESFSKWNDNGKFEMFFNGKLAKEPLVTFKVQLTWRYNNFYKAVQNLPAFPKHGRRNVIEKAAEQAKLTPTTQQEKMNALPLIPRSSRQGIWAAAKSCPLNSRRVLTGLFEKCESANVLPGVTSK